MRWFKNLKMTFKLGIGFGACILLAVAIGAISLTNLRSIASKTAHLSDNVAPRLAMLGDMGGAMRMGRLWQYRMVFIGQDKFPECRKNMTEQFDKVQSLLDKYGSFVKGTSDESKFKELKGSWDQYLAKSAEYDKLIEKGDKAANEEFIVKTMGPIFTKEVIPNMNESSERLQAEAKQQALASKAAERTAFASVITMLIAAIAVSIMFATVIMTAIRSCIKVLSQRMNQLNDEAMESLKNGFLAMEQGDLTYNVQMSIEEIPNPGKDETGMIASMINSIIVKVKSMSEAYERTRIGISEIVIGLQANAELVASTSEELSASAEETTSTAASINDNIQTSSGAAEQSAKSSENIARGSEQLARTATEAAHAMELLEEAISIVKQGGETQKTNAEQAGQHVANGMTAVEETVASMGRIKEQVDASAKTVRELGHMGQEIGGIVQTIEDIAQQTNLLALNAAIEAARAGDHGKGFAVVADEVRKLAERSSEATQEIGNLIASVKNGVEQAVAAMDASGKEVDDGVERSSGASKALELITRNAKEAAQAVEHAQNAVESMVSTASKVSDGISTVASISQENAAAAQQLSAASQEISASSQTISAAIQEQTAGIEQVNAAAQELSSMSTDLYDITRQFTADTQVAQSKKLSTRTPRSRSKAA